MCLAVKVLFDDLDSSVVFDITVVSAGGEAVEVGAGGHVGGIPEIVVGGYVFLMEDTGAPLVVDIKSVDGIAHTLDKILDDEAVIDAVTVGRDDIGELQIVVDDEYRIGSSVRAVDNVARRCQVVGAGDEAHTIDTRDVAVGSKL